MPHALVMALFDNATDAAAAARDLRKLGIPRERVSIVARSHDEEGAFAAQASPRATGALRSCLIVAARRANAVRKAESSVWWSGPSDAVIHDGHDDVDHGAVDTARANDEAALTRRRAIGRDTRRHRQERQPRLRRVNTSTSALSATSVR